MHIQLISVIYLKELKDVLRDRRTLISMILVPILLFPLLIGGVGYMMGGQIDKIEKQSKPILVLGHENSPDLVQFLRDEEQFQVVDAFMELDKAKEMLKDKTFLTIVTVPEGFEEQLQAFFQGEGEMPEVTMFSDESEMESDIAKNRVSSSLKEYRGQVVSGELARLGLREDLVKPFGIQSVNTASEEEMGGFIAGMMLPYMVILLTLMGAMYPAIDLTAGEKERGTMETLIISPVGRMDIVLGKYLVIVTASLVTAILALISMSITLSGGFIMSDIADEGMKIALAPGAVAGMLALMIPMAMLFSAILMSIAVFARSYKEAQSYISPLMIVVILPAMASYLPGVELTAKLAITPVVNMALMMKGTLTGNFDMAIAGLVFLSTLVYAGFAIFIAFRMFQKESVLFRV